MAANPTDPPVVLRCFSCLGNIRDNEQWLPACNDEAYHNEGHVWHTDCAVTRMTQLARSGSTSGFGPIKCCHRAVQPTTIAAAKAHMSDEDQNSFKMLELEFHTPAADRLYCFGCTLFVPPTQVRDGFGTCTNCDTLTCKTCVKAKHDGPCMGLELDEELAQLVRNEDLKYCGFCGATVEHIGGCHHITCTCGKEWCNLCQSAWKNCGCPTGIIEHYVRGNWEGHRQQLIDELSHALAERHEPFADSAMDDNGDLLEMLADPLRNPLDIGPEDLGRHMFDDDAAQWLNLITSLHPNYQPYVWRSVARAAQRQWDNLTQEERLEIARIREFEQRRALPTEDLAMPATYAEYVAHVYTKRLIINGENYQALLQRIEAPRYGQWGPRTVASRLDHTRQRHQLMEQSQFYNVKYGPRRFWNDDLILHIDVSQRIEHWLLSGRAIGRTVDSPQLTEPHHHAWTPAVIPPGLEHECEMCHFNMRYSEAVCTQCTAPPICTLCAVRLPKTFTETPPDFVADVGPSI